jgi:hypothetical protein
MAAITKLEIPDTVLAWLRTGERGSSSDFIVEHLWGIPAGDTWNHAAHPWDPAALIRSTEAVGAKHD